MGRQPAWERLIALDHLEHGLLLAEEVLVGPGDDGDGAVRTDAGRLELLDRPDHPRDLLLETGLEAQVHPVRSDGETCDDQALDQLVWVGSDQRTVLERSRLAFGAVAHDEPLPPAAGGDAGPLRAGREATATSSAQARQRHLRDRCVAADLSRSRDACAPGLGGQVLLE